MRRYAYNISNFICKDCGMLFPLPRAKKHMKEKGHIKDIYCPKCNKITKFKEIRDCDLIDEDSYILDKIG